MLFGYWFIDEHLGCFYLFSILSSAVMKMNRWPLGQVGPGGGQEGPWGRIYVTMTLMSWLRGPVEGRARKDQGAMVPTVLGRRA